MFATLLVDVDEKIAQEFIRGTALYFLLISLFVLTVFLSGKRDLAISWIPGPEQVALVAFALVSTVHAISHIVDTEIPRLKFIFRLVYGCYLIYVTSPYARRVSRIGLVTTTVLVFSSFLFNWTFIVGLVRSIPLFLLLLFYWSGAPAARTWKYFRQDNFTILVVIALVALVVANLWNANLVNGVEGVLRFLSGALLFALIKNAEEDKVANFVVRSLLLVAGLHVVIFSVSVLIAASMDGSLSVFTGKRSHFAGVNVNDISGYLITVFPLILGVMFVNGNNARKRLTVLALLFFGCLFLLLVVKSRSAWPIMGFSIAMVAYFMIRWSPARLENVKAMRWIVPGVVILGLVVLVMIASRAREMAYLAEIKTLEIRFDLWRLALRALSESPVFGIGSENYSVLSGQKMSGAEDLNSFGAAAAFFRESGAYIHCHNLILQLWLDGGIVYMIAIVGLIVLGIYRGMSRSRDASDFIMNIAASVTLIAILLQGSLNYHFMNHPTWLTTWILLGVVARSFAGSPVPPDGRQSPAGMGKLQTVAVVLAIAFMALHIFVLRNHGDALRIVLPDLFKTSQDSYLLEGDKKPESLKRATQALTPSLAAARLYSVDPRINQFTGEIYFFMFERDGTSQSRSGALEYYSRCLRFAPASGFCARRLSQLLRYQNPQDPQADAMMALSKELDPFGLLDSGLLRRL